MLPASLTQATAIIKANDIFKSIDPAFDAFSPANNDTAITAANSNSSFLISLIPLSISEFFSFDANLTTPTMTSRAKDIFISKFPAALPCSPANLDAITIPANNSIILVITDRPLSISDASSLLIIFMAITTTKRANAILNNILPMPFRSFTAPDLDVLLAFDTAINTNATEPIAMARFSNIGLIFSGSISDSFFNAIAANNNPPAKATIVMIEAMLNFAVIESILLTTNAKAANTPASTTSAPTADHNLPYSN